jgi:hypothetical protein
VGDGAAVRIYLSANTAGGLSTGRLLFVRLRCAARALLNVCLVGEACDPGGDQPESAGLGRDAPTRGIRHATISRIAAVIHSKQIIVVPRQPLQGKGAQLSSVTRTPVLEDSKHKKENICILCAQPNAIYLQFTARARKVRLAYSQHVYRLLHHLVHNLPRGLDFLDDTCDLAHQERDINILSVVHVLR